MPRRARSRTSLRPLSPPVGQGTLVFPTVLTCARCGQQNPDGARSATPAARRSRRRPAGRGAPDRLGPLRRPRRLHARPRALDPEDVRAILTPYYERVRDEIERFGGTVEKFIGDAVMGVFGAPMRTGTTPSAPCAPRSRSATGPSEDGLEVRIAVNTGEAIVALEAQPGAGEAMVAGDVVNTAARLQSAAPVGAVLVGEETYAARAALIEYRPAPAGRREGQGEPVRRLARAPRRRGAGERPPRRVPMVGRERELAVSRDLGARRRPSGAPISSRSSARPGSASRASRSSSRSSWRPAADASMRGRSTPYGASSAVQRVRAAGEADRAASSTATSPPRRSAKLAAGDRASSSDRRARTSTRAHLAMLLGLGERRRRRRPRDALLLGARARRGARAASEPTLLLFEDIHWADASLLDLIETLAARVRDVPVLLARARAARAARRAARLGRRAARRTPRCRSSRWPGGEPRARRAAARTSDGAARRRAEPVAETAEGNPLFIEELAGVARRALDGRHASELPTSIRAIVAARLDALPPGERARARRRLSRRTCLLARRAGADRSARATSSALLGSLEERDLIRREAVSRIAGDQQFAFKHGLIRDVAYAALPRAARRERHAAVARFLEETTGGVRPVARGARAPLARGRRAASARRATCWRPPTRRGAAGRRSAPSTLYREALELVPEDDAKRVGHHASG